MLKIGRHTKCIGFCFSGGPKYHRSFPELNRATLSVQVAPRKTTPGYQHHLLRVGLVLGSNQEV